jgi:hypothetical protein
VRDELSDTINAYVVDAMAATDTVPAIPRRRTR